MLLVRKLGQRWSNQIAYFTDKTPKSIPKDFLKRLPPLNLEEELRRDELVKKISEVRVVVNIDCRSKGRCTLHERNGSCT